MSEEAQVVQESVEVPDGKPEESPAGAPPAPSLPPAVLEELQYLREENRRRDEELHTFRVAALQSAGPQFDPVEEAYKRLQKDADPDAFKYIGPVVRPLLEEIYAQRRINEQLGQNMEYLAQRDREREVHTQLSSLIPDLPTLGPKMLELVGKLPASTQKLYAANPQLFVPLAESLRAQTGKKGNAAARVAMTMDTGGGGDRVIPTTADAIANMDPNSKEFEALQRSFYGGNV